MIILQESVRSDGYVEVILDENLQNEEKFLGVLNKIKELINNGINENDIAILCYTNSDVLELFLLFKRDVTRA